MRNNESIKIIEKRRAKFKPIPIILTLGLLYHKLIKGKRIDLFFTHFIDEKKIKLVYMKSTSDSSLFMICKILKSLENFSKKNDVNKMETLVVNPYLTEKIMSKYGWNYLKCKMIVGKQYEKIII